jgi:hypothetical protein
MQGESRVFNCTFLAGRAGAGAGIENLVQVAEFGFSRQL